MSMTQYVSCLQTSFLANKQRAILLGDGKNRKCVDQNKHTPNYFILLWIFSLHFHVFVCGPLVQCSALAH